MAGVEARDIKKNVLIAPRLPRKDAMTAPTAPTLPERTASADLVSEAVSSVVAAQREYAAYDQVRVDRIVAAAAAAAVRARIDLAKAAVAETGMGVVEDKVIKNHFAAEYVHSRYRGMRTVGELEYDVAGGFRRIAEPLGVVAGVIPVTNPTSTAIFKCLLALKTRNGIVLSPHPRAKACTALAARVLREAAEAAGAPAGLITVLDAPDTAATQRLMGHPQIALILATGGPGMVRAAYGSGRPAIGVGAGNTPALVDESADLAMAAASIVLSKTFDNGMICASEQAVVAVEAVAERLLAEFTRLGAVVVKGEDRERLARFLVKDGKLNGAVVGRSAPEIAALAGIAVPATAKILIAEAERIGADEPFSMEKLSPVLAFYRARDWAAGVRKAKHLIEYGGRGHTAALYTAPQNAERIDAYARAVEAARVLVNSPSSHGAIGDLYNFRLEPSLTLGCGSWGGNSVSENVGPKHLLNIKTVAERRENMLWYRVPPKLFFKPGCLPIALAELAGRQRAVLVTDRTMVQVGIAGRVADLLRRQGLAVDIFDAVAPDPDIATVEAGVARLRALAPDAIVALGGGSPMDAAKLMWLLYERPETSFADLSMRFMDILKRVHGAGTLGAKACFVAIPTTSGTGSEVTPFAVITGADGVKYPIADYALTPSMAIVDPDLAMGMPKGLTAASGMDAVSHAVEALASVVATEFTDGQAIDALRLLFAHLPAAYDQGAQAPEARAKVHYAATLAGMAFANAFLGVCHSLAHKVGAAFHVPHGVANAVLLPHVIRYNADPAPAKLAAFPQYRSPCAAARYARAAEALGLGGADDAAKAEALARAVEELRARVGLPATLSAAGIGEADFRAQAGAIAERAFDDQCSGANPRFPLISELRGILERAWA